MKVKLSRAGLLAARAAIEEQSRYQLSAILVTDREVQATNGYVAVRVPHGEAAEASDEIPSELAPFLLRREDALLLAKKMRSLPRDLRFVEIAEVDGRLEAELGDIKLTFPKAQGQFPNLDAITPKGEPVIELNLNPGLLSDLLETLRKISPLDETCKFSIYGGADGYSGGVRQLTIKIGNVTALMISQRS